MVARNRHRRLTPPAPPVGKRVIRALRVDQISIKSLADAHRYREEVCARKPEDDQWLARCRICERCVLWIVLAAFAAMYYLIEVNVAVLSLPELGVAVNIKTTKSK